MPVSPRPEAANCLTRDVRERARVQFGAQNGGGAVLAEMDAVRYEVRRRMPAVVRQPVNLVLEDEEAGVAKAAAPAVGFVLKEPAVVFALAARDSDQDPSADAAQFAHGLVQSSLLRVEAVPGAVAADVLDRRDAEDDVERMLLERQVAEVGLHRSQPGDVGTGEVDSDELRRTE